MIGRRDFQELAKELRTIPESKEKQALVELLITVCTRLNPRFKSATFRVACGLFTAPTGWANTENNWR